jgi:hypothetical protein
MEEELMDLRGELRFAVFLQDTEARGGYAVAL